MKNFVKKGIISVVILSLIIISTPAPMAYTAPQDTVRIGLYYGSTALSAANLQNVDGYGSGYDIGYFDANRDFVSLGARIGTNKISMLVDKNMYTTASSNVYSEGTAGPIVVGCFHLKSANSYDTYTAAKNAADKFDTVNAFPRYQNGAFYVCVGSYTSRDAAVTAASELGIADTYSVDSGTSYTVTIVATETGKILFEFDCGSDKNLAIMPVKATTGKTITWFKGYKYYGGFQYSRISGGNLTVVNFVDVEDYIKGVIPYEMSASWPIEALKAQAVSARTYLMSHLNAHSKYGFDLCNTTDCQVYYGTNSANSNSDSAVEQTKSQYLMYDGKLCETYYCSSNGGATENSENIWSAALPYLRGVKDPYEANIASSVSNYYWTKTYTGDQLASRLRGRGYDCSTIVNFEITKFTEMGNVYSVKLTDSNGKVLTFSKSSARTVIGAGSQRYTVEVSGGNAGDSGNTVYVNSSSGKLSGALSSAYAVGRNAISELLPSGDVYAITGSGTVAKVSGGTSAGTSSEEITFTLKGSGSGHNIGMSQWGAYSMAKYYSKSYADILAFYYSGSQIVTAK